MSNDDFYVICKFTSGEQVMAVLVAEDETHIELENPMTIRTVPIIEVGREQITAHPFCQFSDETDFVISKKNILFIKKMHHVFVPHYQRIVEEHNKTTFIARDGSKRAEDLDWEDETILRNPDNAKKAMEMLQAIFGAEEEQEEEKPVRNFVKGNDTIN
jgi:hypothetical protein